MSTLTKEQVENLELQREEATVAKERGEALQRLKGNADYQLIVESLFLQEYPRDMADAIVKNTGAYDADKLAENIKAINTYVGFTMKIGSDYTIAISDINQITEILNKNDLDEVEGE